MTDVLVIGGGAAGLMAAGTATNMGADVTVLEHSRKTCLKLGITGKGRCNLTNACAPGDMVEATVHGGRFLYGAFTRTTAADVMDLFESLGVPLKVERGRRVFPVSDNAFDVVDALRRYSSRASVKFCDARSLIIRGGACEGVRTENEEIRARAVILAAGGMSYPKTGSDGSGFTMAKAAGHRIITPEPSLVPLNADRRTCEPLAGLSLKNIELELRADGKRIWREQGEMLFTHTGISGPLVLTAGARMRGDTVKTYEITLDLKPALDEKALDSRLIREFSATPNVNFSSVVPRLLPKSMTHALCARAQVSPGQKVNEITRVQRLAVVRALKKFELGKVTKRGFDEAVVTAGGVATDEINPRTMESKLVKNLYFAGEVIDADAFTGGYNLHIAWATGICAARAACKAVDMAEEK